MVTRRDLIAGAGAAALAAAARPALAQSAAPRGAPALEEFYGPPATADVALSPSGNRIAVLRNRPTKKGVEALIDIYDARDPAAPPKSVRLGDHEASTVAWGNETRLMVWIVYDVTRKGYPHESIVRIVTLNDDGTKPAVLFGNRGSALQWIHDLGGIVDDLPDDPDNVLMRAWEPQRGRPALFKVDVNTGVATVLEYGALRTGTWLTQDGVPMIRLDADRRGSTTRIMARAPGESDWKFVHAFRDDQAPEFSVFGPTDRPGVFLGAARMPGEDKVSVREVELASLKLGAPMLTPEKVDAGGVWLDRRNRLLAMTWRDDRTAYRFAEPALEAHFQALQAHFGPELSIDLREIADNRSRILGMASGPREPGVYFLYDANTRAVTELGRRGPHLTAERLGRVHALSVKTRDGASIPAYLTQPASGAPGPLVVMPHGGPETRDHWGYDPWAQALAAKGWWVLQVNFRGSGGYGLQFASAGWRRWGERMQEDVEDAVAQAIADHRLDASKVAIMGGSYGGYAALMGAVRRPELYKAVVSIAGVSDLIDMLRWELAEDDTPAKDHYEFWRKRIGDPEADAEALAKASPRRRAAEIAAPVLLIHGAQDDVVPIEQSRIMAKALQAAGKPVQLVEIKWGGHSSPTDEADHAILSRSIAFLEKALA